MSLNNFLMTMMVHMAKILARYIFLIPYGI